MSTEIEQNKTGQYRILWYYGAYEGYSFHSVQKNGKEESVKYNTAEQALEAAMYDARAQFTIVKVVTFAEK